MSTNELYEVTFSEYAKSHFMKSFSKQYLSAWNITLVAIESMLSHIDAFIATSKATRIHVCEQGYIVKCEFKIAGSNESPKTSGNRIIAYVDVINRQINVLLVYTKTDIKGQNETARREKEIKQNFSDVYKLFNF